MNFEKKKLKKELGQLEMKNKYKLKITGRK